MSRTMQLAVYISLVYAFSMMSYAASTRASSRSRSYASSKAAASRAVSTSDNDVKSPDYWRKRKIICLFNSQYHYKVDFRPQLIDPKLCTHINYEFAFLDNTDHHLIIGDPKLDIQQNFYEQTTSLKMKNPRVKVILSLGGWVDSTKKYSVLVGNKQKRESFVGHVVPFLKQHKFDGLDIAWEYPNAWQGKIGIAPHDKPNFSLFLQELRKAFDEENLELSVSVAAVRQEIEAAYNVSEVSAAVHHINVMAFDLHGPWEHKTGHHAQFAKRPHEASSFNLEESLKIWVEGGAERIKLMVGIPSYGKSFTLLHNRLNAMGAPVSGPGRPGPKTRELGYLAFNEICYLLFRGNWTEVEDSYSGPFAYKGDQWVSYDNLKQVVRKVKFSIDHGFGGILFKDVTGDDFNGHCYNVTYPLLRTIQMEIVRREIADHI